MCENGVGVDQLVFAGNERPGGGEVVIIFAIDDRIGAGLAELGFLEGAGVRGVGSIGDRIGEARGDLVAVESVCDPADAGDHGGGGGGKWTEPGVEKRASGWISWGSLAPSDQAAARSS